MMKRPLRILLLLAFALLQCAAPLVHAHVDGQLSGLLPPSLETQHHPQMQADCAIEENESPAITLPNELQRDDQPSLTQPHTTQSFDILPVATAKLAPAINDPDAVFSPYRKSHPQAPPL